ncbi:MULTISPECIES: ABC transporter permease [Bacillus]|uniref:ABC transporter permease n=2 Tax=Bacillus TaxID=1386 RepID=A0A0M4FTK4_9BACI|nr:MULTISPECIES: ABC transporter permease [Bacillus]ALC83047.1 ABC transporter permease [Bacillus gobiensis]MBP1082083.1 putative ABC transport system permease protein [Bacillus capparidis]MED1096708.1 ABC transporter permease [Bacillus capparidis]
MTFRQFAFNNVTRNKRLYIAYFLSSMFTVMVFFTFAVFAFHPALSGDALNSDMGGKASFGLYVAAGIIYAFSFFFVLYSMSAFLQSRKKEFGVLMVQGMSMRQIRTMVFLENMLIGFFATIGGIALGLVFTKVILLAAENVLIIENKLNFYFPLMAILLTLASFIVLFLFISFFVSFVLRSRKLINLIKGDKKSKGEPKASIFLTILAVLLLASGYCLALMTKGVQVFNVMLPVVIVVILGTYLLFTQLSVFVIRRLKKKDTVFWRKTNMLLFSDLSFRMKDNARTFFMVAIISTVAFSAIGTLYGLHSLLTGSTKNFNAYTFSYTSQEDNTEEEKDVAFINETLNNKHIETEKMETILGYFDMNGQEQLIARQSDYNQFAELIGENKIELADGEAKVVDFEGYPYSNGKQLLNEPIPLESGLQVQPKEIIQSKALPNLKSYYVVTDEDYEQLKNPINVERIYAWQAESGNKQTVIEAGEILSKDLEPYQLKAKDYELYDINRQFGPVLFIGLFIGVVFFVSAGSFLYFRLYSDLDDDKQKFKAIAKMGLTENELKKVLNRQTAILFFAPISVALIHGAIALTALSHAFQYDLFKESAVVLGVFFAIQVIYFFVVRFFYSKQIQAEI